MAKRLFDIIFASLGLLLSAPLFGVIAAAIKLSSKGPLFYVAPRAGRYGVPFGQLKFRTMRIGADRAGAFTAKNDSRIFPAGRILRLFKLDELPQLWNVLRGDMSFVGPRPEEINIVSTCYTPDQRRVLDVPPGLTGLPQVRFFPELSIIATDGMDPQEHYREVILPMRLDMDLEYVSRQSFWFDLYLIAWTAWLILFSSWRVLFFGAAERKMPEQNLICENAKVQ
jgi:lipopolysaccharide/colanic/teichoic acid biosynthesis glycosyltransferase